MTAFSSGRSPCHRKLYKAKLDVKADAVIFNTDFLSLGSDSIKLT